MKTAALRLSPPEQLVGSTLHCHIVGIATGYGGDSYGPSGHGDVGAGSGAGAGAGSGKSYYSCE